MYTPNWRNTFPSGPSRYQLQFTELGLDPDTAPALMAAARPRNRRRVVKMDGRRIPTRPPGTRLHVPGYHSDLVQAELDKRGLSELPEHHVEYYAHGMFAGYDAIDPAYSELGIAPVVAAGVGFLPHLLAHNANPGRLASARDAGQRIVAGDTSALDEVAVQRLGSATTVGKQAYQDTWDAALLDDVIPHTPRNLAHSKATHSTPGVAPPTSRGRPTTTVAAPGGFPWAAYDVYAGPAPVIATTPAGPGAMPASPTTVVAAPPSGGGGMPPGWDAYFKSLTAQPPVTPSVVLQPLTAQEPVQTYNLAPAPGEPPSPKPLAKAPATAKSATDKAVPWLVGALIAAKVLL
jgi:hypothetical protein